MMLLKRGAAFLGMFTIAVGGCASAFAFDDIETYAAYNGAIKQEIMSEFSSLTKTMKVDGFGMTLREKDINVLRQRMYDKAVLMGRCVDKAATIKRKGFVRNSVEKGTSECIEEHLKFISREPAIPIRCAGMKVWEPPYDFLIYDSISSATDYLAIKQCYDHLAAKARLGHELGLGWGRLMR